MTEKRLPMNYAIAACNTIMNRFTPEELPPTYKLNYHHGVFFSGLLNTYFRTNEEKLYDYLKTTYEVYVRPDGTVKNEEDSKELDDLQPGINMFCLYKRTGDERYKKALDNYIELIKGWERNAVGGFWHKNYFPNQMWLDALYMVTPLCAEYAVTFNAPELMDIAVEQIELMWENTHDDATGLLFHGFDSSKEAEWADKVTGRAPTFWGRSIGWVGVAIADVLGFMDANHPKRALLEGYLKQYVTDIAKYQDKDSGLWYQVVHKGSSSDNWLETSCSCLFVYSFLAAVELGIVSKEFADAALKGYDGVIGMTERDENNDLVINNVCVGTGIGTYEYYVGRPTKSGDLHGMGTFLLMCAKVYDYIK